MTDVEQQERPRTSHRWVLLAILPLLLGGLVYGLWRSRVFAHPAPSAGQAGSPASGAGGVEAGVAAPLPDFSGRPMTQGDIRRTIDSHTTKPERSTLAITPYTVQSGDSVFSIANQFDVKPETILWGNFDLLHDDPELLKPGQVLMILPVNGVYYKWQEGDTVETVAAKFKTTPEEILNWPANNLNPLDPQVQVGDWVIVPGGSRPFKDWGAPIMVGKRYSFPSLGPGACPGGYSGPVGTGAWHWPGYYHYLSGNDFWSGHPGIDIAATPGTLAYAADAGVVVFAGWSTVGYGNLVILDHGNGWVTFYAHLAQINVVCGQGIGWGGFPLGLAGTTGNSTGTHIHFEMRLFGTPENPHLYLPWG